MNLTVRVDKTYGTKRVYPVCPQSLLIAELIKQQTFQPRHIEILKQLGYTLSVQPETL